MTICSHLAVTCVLTYVLRTLDSWPVLIVCAVDQQQRTIYLSHLGRNSRHHQVVKQSASPPQSHS